MSPNIWTRTLRLGAICLLVAFELLTGANRAQALTSDQSKLVRLTQATIDWVSPTKVHINGMAIRGTYALVNWDDSENSGGELLAVNVNGAWRKIVSTGGQYSAADLSHLHGVPQATARFLAANIRPLPPTGGPSISAGGASTHAVYLERCGMQAPPHRFYHWYGHGASSISTYATGNVQPSSVKTAVVADITVRSGTVLVSLFGPNGSVLKAVTLTAGETGGVGYLTDIAQAGVYTVRAQGNVTKSTKLDCVLLHTSYATDAVWTGTLSW